jgi:hypothetical protein
MNIDETPVTPELNAAIEVLQKLAIDGTEKQRKLHPKRKPIWAPAIAFSQELIEALRPYHNDCKCPFGRLWPYFSWGGGKWWDEVKPIRTFNLHAGVFPNGKSVIMIAKNFKPPTWSIHNYPSTPHAEHLRNPGVAELIKFAADPETVLVAGARVSGICYRCYKPLTDPVSRQRGIGPECFKKVRVDESILPMGLE